MPDEIVSIQKALLADAAEAALRLNTEPDVLARVLAASDQTTETTRLLRERLQRGAKELGENRHALAALRASWSWRLTAPLRALLNGARMIVLFLQPGSRGLWRKHRLRGLVQWVVFYRLVRGSRLFDDAYYASGAALHMNPLLYFFIYGVEEKNTPNCLFNTQYYLENNPDVARSWVNPLVHYLKWGAYEGRDPHPAFDSSYYLEDNPDVFEARLNPLAHYLAPGIIEGRNPNAWFDTLQYLEENPDVAALGLNPLWHCMLPHHMERRPHVFGRDSHL